MNKAAELLEYLSTEQASLVVILAPNAPPVIRTATGLALMMQLVLDANDVMDTLKGLQGHMPNLDVLNDPRGGTFSFGVRGLGRFRVVHVSQRGSKMLHISRVPFAIPEMDTVCPDAGVSERLLNFVGSGDGGLLLVSGPLPLQNSTLVYALLSRINHCQRKILYTVERALTFLMPHEESIVIQSELGTDVKSFAEGIESALLLEPNFFYIGDVRSNDDLIGLVDVLRVNTLTILSGGLLHNMAFVERIIPYFKQGDGYLSKTPVLQVHTKLDPSGVPCVKLL